ncbi:MAG: hypothetical protein ACRD04_11880 [Terriglobales bacterium]
MDPLHQALDEIAAIRGQMARANEFRGYGPATLAATALVAVAAGLIQPLWAPDPVRTPERYVALWAVAAAVAAALIACEAVARTRRLHSALSNAMIRAALEQFLPAATAGLLLTIVVLHWIPADLSLLPALWLVVFSLGVFASCRFLPRAARAVGVWYLITGLWALSISAGPLALRPWVMAAPFAVGQALAAAILWSTAEAGAAAAEGLDERG